MSSRDAIINERIKQLQRALAVAQQGQAKAESAGSSASAAAAAWEQRARAAEDFIHQLERDIRVGLIRTVVEAEDLAHAYAPPGQAAAVTSALRAMVR